MKSKWMFAALSAALVFCATCPIAAQVLSTPFRLNTDSAALRAPNGEIVYNSQSHEFLAAWNFGGNLNPPTEHAYFQRFSTNGMLLGPNTPVLDNVMGQRSENYVRVAYNSTDNQYFVTSAINNTDWHTYPYRTHGQVLAADGSQIGNTFIVDTAGIVPEAFYNPAQNEYLFVGQDAARSLGVFAKRLTPSGAPIGNSVRLDQPTAGQLSYQSMVGKLTYNSNRNEFLKLHHTYWDEYRVQEPGKPDKLFSIDKVELQIIPGDGSAPARPSTLDTFENVIGPTPYYAMEAAYDPGRHSYLLASEYGGGVRSQFLDDEGVPTSAFTTVFQGHPNQGFNASLARINLVFDPIHQMYLLTVLQDYKRVIAQLLDAAGRPMGAPLTIASGDWVGDMTTIYSEGVNGFAISWPQGISTTNGVTADMYVRFLSIPEPSTMVAVLWLALCVVAWRSRSSRRR